MFDETHETKENNEGHGATKRKAPMVVSPRKGGYALPETKGMRVEMAATQRLDRFTQETKTIIDKVEGLAQLREQHALLKGRLAASGQG